MSKTPKISAAQLLLLLLLARLMHTMIFRFDEFTSGTPLLLGLLITTLTEAILAIPAVIYYETGGAAIIKEFKHPRAVGLLYSAYFTVIAGGTAALFAEFLHREFSGTVAPLAAIIFLSAAAAYCAYMGIEGLARAGTAIFWLFAALFVLMVLVSEGEFEFLNIRPMISGDFDAVVKYITDSFSSSWQIPMLVILGENLRKGAAKAAYGFLAAKFLIIGTLLMLVTLVLWRYIGVLGYPIFALGAYAKSDFIQRFDAINMMIWALNCVLAAAVYFYICGLPISPRGGGITKKIAGNLLFPILAAAFAIYEYKRGLRLDEPWFLFIKSAGVIVLGTVIPIAAIIIRKIGRRKESAF